jgi:hypothetical protein
MHNPGSQGYEKLLPTAQNKKKQLPNNILFIFWEVVYAVEIQNLTKDKNICVQP